MKMNIDKLENLWMKIYQLTFGTCPTEKIIIINSINKIIFKKCVNDYCFNYSVKK